MTKFNIETKSHGFTSDSAPNMIAAMHQIKQNEPLFDLIHVRCSTHVINLVVEAGITHLEEYFEKIRYYCKKVILRTKF